MKIVDFVKLPEIISDGIWSNDFIEKELSQLSENCEYIVVKKENLTGKNKETILEECDIYSINRFIEIAKAMNKKVKLVFDFGNVSAGDSGVNKEYGMLKQISDLDYVTFFDRDYYDDEFKVEFYNGKEVKNSYDTLVLCCKDIKESNLSPFEKLLACYDITKSFKKYTNARHIASSSSRALPLVMNNDYEVCTGYSNMFVFLCNECGINATSYSDVPNNHQLVYASIEDDKYGIHGYYKFDPTGDVNEENIIFDHYDYFGCDIKSNETVMDEFLTTDYSIAREYMNNKRGFYSDMVENYIVCLEPSWSELDSEELFERFHDKFSKQKSTSIDMLDIQKASARIEEFVSQRKYSDEQRIRTILDNYDKQTNQEFICMNTTDEREKLKLELASLDKNGFGRISQINLNNIINNKTKLNVDNNVSIVSDNTLINGIVFPRKSIEFREFLGYYLRTCIDSECNYNFEVIRENDNSIVGSNLLIRCRENIILEVNGLNVDETVNIQELLYNYIESKKNKRV